MYLRIIGTFFESNTPMVGGKGGYNFLRLFLSGGRTLCDHHPRELTVLIVLWCCVAILHIRSRIAKS